MPHDVPLATEGGSHNTGIFRAHLYAIRNGQEGLADPTDARVSASEVPDSYINVAAANYTIVNREPGYPKEMYSGRLQEREKIAVNPTTSAGGRTDLVVFRVENPDAGAWPPLAADKRADGPYVHTRLIPNVPAGTVSVRDLPGNYSAITLARITLPPSTATITNSMITNLRETSANPVPAPGEFYDIQNFTGQSSLPPPANGSGTRTTAWVAWPAGATWQVPVPTWATELQATYEVNPIVGDNTWGDMRIVFNSRPLPAVNFDINYPLWSGTNPCYFTNGGGLRSPYKTGGKLAVTAAERGKTVAVRVEARTIDGSNYRARGTSIVNTGSMGELTIRFKQAAAAS